jgi:hypothetical protein
MNFSQPDMNIAVMRSEDGRYEIEPTMRGRFKLRDTVTGAAWTRQTAQECADIAAGVALPAVVSETDVGQAEVALLPGEVPPGPLAPEDIVHCNPNPELLETTARNIFAPVRLWSFTWPGTELPFKARWEKGGLTVYPEGKPEQRILQRECETVGAALDYLVTDLKVDWRHLGGTGAWENE